MENSSNNTLLKVVVAIETLAIIGLLSVYFQSPSFLTGSLSEQECREQCESVCSGTSNTAGQVSSPATEDCSTDDDEDQDGLGGCLDTDCNGHSTCPRSSDGSEFYASDSILEDCSTDDDEDQDGLGGCLDTDCNGHSTCPRSSSSTGA